MRTIYKTKDGTMVPGVTTLTSELAWNKQVLIVWANRLGLKGIDSTKYTDDKADIGTLAHSFITDGLKGVKTKTDDFTKNQIGLAENCCISYYEWSKSHTIAPILIETPLVSEIHGFGGTPDLFANVDGFNEIIDFKTGSGIHLEHFIQVAGGYRYLLEEAGYRVDKIRILNIPRTETEAFAEKTIPQAVWNDCFEVLIHCKGLYDLHRKLKQGGLK